MQRKSAEGWLAKSIEAQPVSLAIFTISSRISFGVCGQRIDFPNKVGRSLRALQLLVTAQPVGQATA